MALSEQALDDVKVLDVSQGIAGPFAAKLLADYGADVIKVEPPGSGDCARNQGPFPDDVPHPEKSGLFLYLNTNKRGITLNLASASGQHLFMQLVERVDVIIESFAPAALDRLGLGYSQLAQINPRLILASITPFGQTGPYAAYDANHLLLCALGGWAHLCGVPEREPLQAGSYVSHYIAGTYAAIGVLAALARRGESGQGEHVDTSAWEAMITCALLPAMRYEYTGQVGVRQSRHMTGPSFIFRCKDGYVAANVLTQAQWLTLCQFVGHEEWMEDPRFSIGTERAKYTDEIYEQLAPWFSERSKDEVFHQAQLWRLPFALVPSAEEIVNMEQHQARGYFVEVEHPVAGTFKYPGAPFKMPLTPFTVSRPAPLLGQHNREVYCELLGLVEADLVRLRQGGVI